MVKYGISKTHASLHENCSLCCLILTMFETRRGDLAIVCNERFHENTLGSHRIIT